MEHHVKSDSITIDNNFEIFDCSKTDNDTYYN